MKHKERRRQTRLPFKELLSDMYSEPDFLENCLNRQGHEWTLYKGVGFYKKRFLACKKCGLQKERYEKDMDTWQSWEDQEKN